MQTHRYTVNFKLTKAISADGGGSLMFATKGELSRKSHSKTNGKKKGKGKGKGKKKKRYFICGDKDHYSNKCPSRIRSRNLRIPNRIKQVK